MDNRIICAVSGRSAIKSNVNEYCSDFITILC